VDQKTRVGQQHDEIFNLNRPTTTTTTNYYLDNMAIPLKRLGNSDLFVMQLGLGCMGMSEFYGAISEEEALKTIDVALEHGVNFFDTADMYGRGQNEILLGKAMKGRREKFIVGTKFGLVRDSETGAFKGVNGKRDYVHSACEASLKRLQTDYIDLYYLHRQDPQTPIEETVAAMAELVKEGKVKYIGLSEVDASTLRRAHKVHPITALQSEYSLWSLDVQDEVLATCRELGIALVAYSPLGRGFLTGQIKKFEDLDANDYRRFTPRFQGENFNKNLELVEAVTKIAAEKNVTPGQLALAWLLQQDSVFPIPGTKREKYLLENLDALKVHLTKEDNDKIDSIIKSFEVQGLRYSADAMKKINESMQQK